MINAADISTTGLLKITEIGTNVMNKMFPKIKDSLITGINIFDKSGTLLTNITKNHLLPLSGTIINNMIEGSAKGLSALNTVGNTVRGQDRAPHNNVHFLIRLVAI